MSLPGGTTVPGASIDPFSSLAPSIITLLAPTTTDSSITQLVKTQLG